MCRLIAILIVTCCASVAAAQPDAKEKVMQPSPAFTIIHSVNKEKKTLTVSRAIAVMAPATVTKPIKFMAFSIGTSTSTEMQPVIRVVESEIDLTTWKVMTKKGEIVPTQEALKRFRPGETVPESWTNGLPHERYLSIIFSDVLILVPTK
ncbi:MAG: hypothetical protein FJ303_11775 [Planctomycetes bacterium]|nr:hypothetical protein [Planctomycetota bacterium]